MKQSKLFFYGLLVGFLSCYFLLKNKTAPEKIVAQESKLAAFQPKPKLSLPTRKVIIPEKKEIEPQTHHEVQATMEMVHTMPAETIKRKKKIQFSLQDIMTMESQWQELQDQIQVSREDRGWRVKMLTPNTVFATTGLVEGNLITYDSIRALGDEASSSLPYRISTILNHVSVQ
ncbi:MAG: hypothetical protein H7Z71_04980 [Moraxellaceae bacterium]|nr:hypothetical protein [Pseudobdellovibrionaceae bacterium]